MVCYLHNMACFPAGKKVDTLNGKSCKEQGIYRNTSLEKTNVVHVLC